MTVYDFFSSKFIKMKNFLATENLIYKGFYLLGEFSELSRNFFLQ